MEQMMSVYNQLNDYIIFNIQSYGMEYTVDNYIVLREQYYEMKEPS